MSKLSKKYIIITASVFLLFTTLASIYSYNVQKNISGKVIRLHVLANSNCAEDQMLKLKVRDRILSAGKTLFADTSDIEECRRKLDSSKKMLLAIAEDEIRKNGYDYSVNINVGNYMFPMKSYGNYSLPAGKYNALRIEIGKAEGENWWCVMFPPLCFVDGCIDSESSKLLSKTLSDDELSILNTSDGFSFRFKTIDFFQNTFNSLKTAFKN